MRRLLIVLAGFGLAAGAARGCPLTAPASDTGTFLNGESGVISPSYESFSFADAVSLRLREVTGDSFGGTAGLQQAAANSLPSPDQPEHDGIKLLLGICFAILAGYLYWASPAYEQLYTKLFGRVTDFY